MEITRTEKFIGRVLTVLAQIYDDRVCIKPIFIDKDPLVSGQRSIRKIMCVNEIELIPGNSYTAEVQNVFVRPVADSDDIAKKRGDLTKDGRRVIDLYVSILEDLGKRRAANYREYFVINPPREHLLAN